MSFLSLHRLTEGIGVGSSAVGARPLSFMRQAFGAWEMIQGPCFLPLQFYGEKIPGNFRKGFAKDSFSRRPFGGYCPICGAEILCCPRGEYSWYA